MADDLIQTLTRFHREVVMPDVERAIAFKIDPFRDETISHLDAIYQRLGRLEDEYHLLVEAVRRLEERMDRVEARLGAIEEIIKVEIRNEIDEIKARIAKLQERVAELEAQL